MAARDDTEKLQQWLDEGRSLSDLPPGEYTVSGTIRVPEAAKVKGFCYASGSDGGSGMVSSWFPKPHR